MQYLLEKRQILHIVHNGEKSKSYLFAPVYLDNNRMLSYNFQDIELANNSETVKIGNKNARKLHVFLEKEVWFSRKQEGFSERFAEHRIYFLRRKRKK